MGIPILSELREPPVAGRWYMVSFVRWMWFGVEADWPVMGPRHNDAEFFQFRAPHYHVDARFVTARQARAVSQHWRGDIVSASQRAPLSRLYGTGDYADRDVPIGRPALKRFRCARAVLPYHYAHQPAVEELRAAFGDVTGEGVAPIRRPDGRLLCPHRKVDLSQIEPDENGVVTCPLHGLRVCMRAQ